LDIPRLGVLESGEQEATPFLLPALNSMGWIEGKTIILVVRSAARDQARLPVLAADLVTEKVNVIVAVGTAATRAARQVTTTIPVVMVSVGDPLGSGFIVSLARPGGNTTGVASLLPELARKQLEVLKEVVPHTRKVGILQTGEMRGSGRLTLAALEQTARQLRIELVPTLIEGSADLAARFEWMKSTGIDAYFVMVGPTMDYMRAEIAAQAIQYRIPGIATYRGYAEAGGLLSYGASARAIGIRAAKYVDRILNGASPAELPVEQPDRFELVINLKTAKALGVDVPPHIITLADGVIE
jgi:putative ABC transport system substrate-binding protein